VDDLVSEMGAAEKRLQAGPIRRLQWLLQLAELASKSPQSPAPEDVQHWSAEVFAFIHSAGHQVNLYRKNRDAPVRLNPKEVIDIAGQVDRAVRQLVGGIMWSFSLPRAWAKYRCS